MTMLEAPTPPAAYTPQIFFHKAYKGTISNYAHFVSLMVHPTMGKMISSYKGLMNDPKTAKVWQMAFGKDFGEMAQGDNKTVQKGTNSVFVMTHDEIDIAKRRATNGLTPELSWIIALQKKVLIGLEEHSVATSSPIQAARQHKLPISPRQNCYRKVYSARTEQGICALTLKISTSRWPSIMLNT